MPYCMTLYVTYKAYTYVRCYIYGRDGEMVQKVIEWDNQTCQHMHLILRIRIIIASNSISLRILSYLNIFELNKSEALRQKSTWSLFRGEKWMVRILSHLKIRCDCLLRWLFEPSHHPSRSATPVVSMLEIVKKIIFLLNNHRYDREKYGLWDLEIIIQSMVLECGSVFNVHISLIIIHSTYWNHFFKFSHVFGSVKKRCGSIYEYNTYIWVH